jgi:hypothetical protein
MSVHPYRGLPADQFWTSGVAAVPAQGVDPTRPPPFTIASNEAVAAAGSCFAQHIARHLRDSGFTFLQAEVPQNEAAPVFSARFGNIYTPRQLRQLLLNAYGLHRPAERAWQRQDGRFIDPLRPQIFADGFESEAELVAARREHLLAVRRVFEDCRAFVFTLGLTECWLAPDGTALPVPPGALGVEPALGAPSFRNFTVAEMRADLDQFLADLRVVNPMVRVILTVSPVPLVATYEAKNVLVANTYSKAALRVVAEETVAAHDFVTYFPSYEIITAPQIRGAYFAEDLRSVTEEGVAHVMRVFSANMMRDVVAAPEVAASPVEAVVTAQDRARYEALGEILCDEELLDGGEG